MRNLIRLLILFLILPVLISSISAAIFEKSADIMNPKEIDIFSSISPTKGPFLFDDNLLLTKESSIHILDLSGKTTLSFPTGDRIAGLPKRGIWNEEQIFSVASNNKIFIFNNNKILQEISLNDSILYDHELIDGPNPKIIATFNYPTLLSLNGSTIWERKDIEARGVKVIDLEKDDNLDLVFSAAQLVALDISGNTKWSKDIFCIQPPKIVQLDSNQAQEILCPTKNELIALDSSGNIFWQIDQTHYPSEQALIEVYNNQIVEAAQNKLIFRDLSGQKLKEIQIKITPKSLDIVDINNDGQKDYLISDDLSINAFTNEKKLWSLNIKEGVSGLTFVDIDLDNLLEILVGTTEGIVIVDHVDEPLFATFTISQDKVLAGKTISLDASLSRPTNLNYLWDFESDGSFDTTVSENPKINHTYDSQGIYKITLEVTNGKQTKAARKSLEVFKTNEPPVAKLTTSKSSVLVGSELLFIASAKDREEGQLEYRFDIDNDGFFETPWQKGGSFKTKAALKGTYVALVEVKDQTNSPTSAEATYKVVEPQKKVEEEANQLVFPIIAISVTLIILALIVVIFIYSKKHSRAQL